MSIIMYEKKLPFIGYIFQEKKTFYCITVNTIKSL